MVQHQALTNVSTARKVQCWAPLLRQHNVLWSSNLKPMVTTSEYLPPLVQKEDHGHLPSTQPKKKVNSPGLSKRGDAPQQERSPSPQGITQDPQPRGGGRKANIALSGVLPGCSPVCRREAQPRTHTQPCPPPQLRRCRDALGGGRRQQVQPPGGRSGPGGSSPARRRHGPAPGGGR